MQRVVPSALALSAALLQIPLAPAAQAAPGFLGTSGVLNTPSAEAMPRGDWSLGANYVGKEFRPGVRNGAAGTVNQYFVMGLVPRLEVAAVVTNQEGRLGARRVDNPADGGEPGFIVDRHAAVHWLALQERGARPALAVGSPDLLGASQLYKGYYAVLGKHWGAAQVNLGVGTNLLHGPFGGVQYRLRSGPTLLLEGLRDEINGGVRWRASRNFQLDLAVMGFRSLGGGLSYHRRF
jgi:hypothetical protein